MSYYALHILRVGLAVTFLWVGILILRDPAAWTGFIRPWAAALLLSAPEKAMIGTAILDLTVGAALLVDFLTFWASSAAALHLVIILAVAGIDAITVRDIGLLAGALALAVSLWPPKKT